MNFRIVFLAATVAVVLSACGAATSPQPRSTEKRHEVEGTPEQIVAKSAAKRWDAIIGKNFRPAYDLLTPGTRATTPYDAYAKRLLSASIRWTSARVDSVECEEPDVCRAVVNLTYMVRAAQAGMGDLEGASPVFEQWIRSDGQWYYLPSTTGR